MKEKIVYMNETQTRELVEKSYYEIIQNAHEKRKKKKQAKELFFTRFIILHNNSLVEFEWRVNVYLIIV
jgi:hypothetical protein